MGECDATFDEITRTAKRCAAILRDAEVDFLLAGSVAAWARGGAPVSGDADFIIRPDDVDRAREALREAGFRVEDPPEGWLFKAWDGDVLVDVIHEPAGLALDDTFARSEVLSVASVDMPVMAVDDILVNKLLSFEEHYIDFVGLLPIARALREQADWPRVQACTSESAIATGFFAMAEALGIVPPPGERQQRIRVSTA